MRQLGATRMGSRIWAVEDTRTACRFDYCMQVGDSPPYSCSSCVKLGGRAVGKEDCIGDIRNRCIGGRPEGLLIRAAAVRLDLILTRERSFGALRPGANITTFSKGGGSRIASNSSSRFKVAGGLS